MRVSLMDVDPVVWRRLLVPGGVRLARLNDILQCAMGWTNSHLHCFEIGDERYGMHADEYPDGEIDERSATVVKAIGDHDRFTYEYDFGDSWEHEIVVERVDRVHHGLRSAVCLDGENACPPEDCGGPHGYARLLVALADRTHPDRDELTRWFGGPLDPQRFDLAAVNVELQRLARS